VKEKESARPRFKITSYMFLDTTPQRLNVLIFERGGIVSVSAQC
jgi:hypothetical protein